MGDANSKFGADIDTPPRAQELALVIVATISVGFLGVTLLHIARSSVSAAAIIVSEVTVAALGGMQIQASARVLRGGHIRWSPLFLTLQGLLAHLPHLFVGDLWNGVPGFFVGSVLFSLHGRAAWLLAGCVTVINPLLVYGVTHDACSALDGQVSTALIGLTLFAVVRLANQVRDVHALQMDLAQLAVARERLRFARDLHDLVGHTLSSTSVKAELIHRLLAHDPRAARVEVAELIKAIRQTHSEVRKVAHGYRHLSLESELVSARSTLQAAGIKPHFSHHGGALPQSSGGTLAAVLREAVTNVVRHSAARHCVVRITQHKGATRLIVVNDRPDPARVIEPSESSGLRNLSERVALLGGTLFVSRPVAARGEEFRLEARIPANCPVEGMAGADSASLPQRCLLSWKASDPTLLQGNPDGVNTVSGT
ncbi:sensor histidine kinase [Streptomyces platensis]|uniref:sensor histidine kinase n=1 Tax=Streptomyces platensis TaxID=58346 RepID=UPI00386A2C55|nr:histidine kinase [Streptomyces platensis]